MNEEHPSENTYDKESFMIQNLGPFTKYSVLNILFSYAYITRLDNGEHRSDSD